ncbi:MAG: c-type cytochrome [Deltaproteobacteria bacterium]|nr:c-type cytochrome [Deltaproteobacteria bacterium]
MRPVGQRRRWSGLLAIGAIGLVLAAAASAPGAETDGARLYRLYCASCHGPQGKGDGPDAVIFAAAPRNLHEGFLGKYATDELVERIREGRALNLAFDPTALRARASAVEEVVAHLRRLPAIDWPRVEPGWQLYVERCEICHGQTGRPGATLPPGVHPPRDLSDPAYQRSLSDRQLAVVVRHGRKGMPALAPQVTEAEAKLLAAFVRVLSPGFAEYSRSCANCHGDDGRGVKNLGEVIKLPEVVFDRQYFKQRDPEQLRSRAWHMLAQQKPAMPHYRWTLSEAQARAIVEFLKLSR